jgi:hypothetical protein
VVEKHAPDRYLTSRHPWYQEAWKKTLNVQKENVSKKVNSENMPVTLLCKKRNCTYHSDDSKAWGSKDLK